MLLHALTKANAIVGCMERLEHWLILNAALVGGVSAIVGSLQVIGICFACCLSKSILKDFHDFYYWCCGTLYYGSEPRGGGGWPPFFCGQVSPKSPGYDGKFGNNIVSLSRGYGRWGRTVDRGRWADSTEYKLWVETLSTSSDAVFLRSWASK